MMTDRELMQMALDAMIANAFDYEDDFGSPYNGERKVNEMRAKAAEALRARLAQPEQPDFSKAGFGKPQREWQGLTDEEMREIWDRSGWYVTLFKAVEAKLKEKNNGSST